jgi:hypothetical protein
MPVTTVTPANMIMGPAFVYYRAVGVLTPWTSVGVTLDDAVLRLPTEWADISNLSGVTSAIQGLDVLTKLGCEIEFTIAEIAGSKLSLAIPGAQLTSEVHADSVGSPGSSTITAASLVGATTLAFTATTNFTVGDYFRVEAQGNAAVEYRQITAIQSLNVSFRDPLIYAHTNGTAVVETTGDGRDQVTMPVLRRQPSTAYNEWALVAESGKSGMTELRIPRGISQTTAAEVTVGDSAIAGIRVTVAGRLDPTNLQTSLFQLYSPNAA